MLIELIQQKDKKKKMNDQVNIDRQMLSIIFRHHRLAHER